MNQDINEQCSIKDKKMKAVLFLKGRMHDLAEELNRMHDVMRDNELSNRTKNSELIKLKRTIIPFVYVHKHEECKKRKDTEENRPSTT